MATNNVNESKPSSDMADSGLETTPRDDISENSGSELADSNINKILKKKENISNICDDPYSIGRNLYHERDSSSGTTEFDSDLDRSYFQPNDEYDVKDIHDAYVPSTSFNLTESGRANLNKNNSDQLFLEERISQNGKISSLPAEVRVYLHKLISTYWYAILKINFFI